MLGDLLNRIQGAKLEAQEKLKVISISKSDSNNWVTVTVSGERKILDLNISEELVEKKEPELISDIVANVVNEAIAEAAEREKELMEEVSSNFMPGGLDGFKGLMG
jgi:nucleoid-associated protein EbfC